MEDFVVQFHFLPEVFTFRQAIIQDNDTMGFCFHIYRRKMCACVMHASLACQTICCFRNEFIGFLHV